MKRIIFLIGLAWLCAFADAQNNINQYEYWFDSDFANRVTTNVTPTQLFTLNSAVSAINLANGLHTFHIRFRDEDLNYSAVVSQFFQKVNPNQGANPIAGFEYWFDGNYAGKVSQAVTPQTLYQLNTGISANQLAVGLHTFHVRFVDTGGNWSPTVSQFFQKINPNTPGTNSIVAFEYWFDNDYANKVFQTVTPQTLYQLNSPISADQLENGLHKFQIRFQDTGGSWSSPVSQFFQKTGQGLGIPNVVSSYRYWFDGDVNAMVNQTLNAPSNPLYLITYLNLSQLDTGQHQIHFQFKDGLGQWSAVITDTVIKLGEPRLDFVTPNKGGNTGDVTVSIAGVFFNPLKVRLEKQGELPIEVPDSLVSLFNGQEIRATFDLRDKPVGEWNVVVEILGDTTMTLENGFLIEEGSAAKPWTELIGFSTIRANTWQNYSLKVGNSGNINLYGVPVWVGIPVGMEIEFKFEPLIVGDTLGEYDTLDHFVVLDSLDSEPVDSIRLYSFVVSLIPPNSVVNVSFRIKSPTSGQDTIWTWATHPLFGSPLKPELATCLFNIGVTIGGFVVPIPDCIYDVLVDQLTPIVQGAIIANSNPNASVTEVVPGLLGNYIWSNYKTMVGCLADPSTAVGLLNPLLGKALKIASFIDDAYELYQDCSPVFDPNKKIPTYLQTVFSFDPNEKIGPMGQGAANYYGDVQSLNYAIHFENVDSATANAQSVLILDTLDASVFDFSTFELEHFEIGDTILNVPSGRQHYERFYSMVASQNVVLKITADFNDTTGVASWLFESLDPETLTPISNPFDGFLPPNQDAPKGEGAVHYSINLKSDLSNNTVISNKAYIYFDNNLPLPTQNWQNTLDNITPHSQINQLAAVQSDTLFNVSWNGIDTSSGVRDYDIYVSTNGGTYRLWLLNANSTSATFSGEVDSTYCFYSIAADLAGNAEAAPLLPDACTNIVLTGVIEYQLGEVGKVSVFPNPAKNFVTVFGEDISNAEVIVSLKDILGRQLHTEKLKTMNQSFTTKLDISLMPSGIYFIEIKAGSSSLVEKISVSKG